MSSSNELSAQNVFSVSGRVALVTGGGTGIGLMIAKGLAANGAKVYIGARRSDPLEKARKDHDFSKTGGQLIPLELDVTDKASIREAVQYVKQNDGKLDILINNAGAVGPKSPFFSDPQAPENESVEALGTALFESETFEAWADHYTTNVSSIFFTSTAFLGLLAKSDNPSIVNIGSISGIMKLSQNHFAYNSGKAAVHHLTKIMATELALKGHKIRINAIAAGVFPSEMAGSPFKPIDEEINEISMGLHPLPANRAGREPDIVATVLYLTSPGGSYVNGQVLVLDGGFVAVNPSTA